MSPSRLAIVALTACLLPALPAHAESVGGALTNGGFEEPDAPRGGWVLTTEIPGWEPTNDCRIEVQDHTPDGSPHSGDQFVELDADCSGGIRQTISTEPGLRYLTRYWYSPRTARIGDAGAAYNNVLEVSWDGVLVETLSRANPTLETDWSRHEFAQVATGTASTLTFEDGATDPRGVDDTVGVYVDTVSTVPQYDVCALHKETAPRHPGSTVPVRIRLCDTTGDNLSAPDIDVTALGLVNVDTGETAPAAASGGANPGNLFRYDEELAGYIFNLGTSDLPVGTWQLLFAVSGSDDVSYSTGFVIR